MKEKILIIPIIIFIFFLNCKKETIVNADQKKDLSSDTLYITDSTKWVLKPQFDIPWPSLANSPWPMFLHDPQHTGRSKYVGLKEGSISWKLALSNVSWSSPIIDNDGNIYIGCYDNFYSISKDGNIRWNLQVNGCPTSPLIDNNGIIYFPTPSYDIQFTALYALNSNSIIVWKKNLSNCKFLILSGPNISYDGKTIYISIYDSSFLAINASNGETLWEYKPLDREIVGYNPAISNDGNIYLPVKGRVVALNKDGIELWRYDIHDPSENVSAISIDNNGNIYLTDHTHIYSLNDNGQLRWINSIDNLSLSISYQFSISIGYDGTIFVRGYFSTANIDHSAIYAFDTEGNLKWRNIIIPLNFSDVSSQIIDCDNNVYLGIELTSDKKSNFYTFNKYGRLKFKINLFEQNEDRVALDIPPIINDNNTMYVVNQNYKFSTIYSIK
jgi:outer membrane protein assembly factor BamB